MEANIKSTEQQMTPEEEEKRVEEPAKENIEIENNESPNGEPETDETQGIMNPKKEVKVLKEKNDELEAHLAELNDKYLRLFSEFDNYRKRTLKERLELTKTASEDLIVDLLPVLDDFERALKAMEATEENKNTIDGVKLIYNKFFNLLTKKGLEAMKTLGNDFDTDFHEAITNIPAPTEDMKNKVVDEIEKGYLLGGKVIRFAKVVVGQ